jgi:glyoxylase-like metal-dependent hydrolase (beta-lactamase superfamily II)
LQDTLTIDQSLALKGFHRNDITDVLLTHLHFDHCGGSIEYNSTREHFQPAFPNAKFWSNENHWKWATEPNPREKASFLSENILPIQESGQLNFIERVNNVSTTPLGFDVLFVDGHTDSMMIPHISYMGKTVVFMADLLPSVGHIPLAYVMGYDTRPLLTLSEKELFLNTAADNGYVLFFEHDSVNECCTFQHTEKGVRLKEAGRFTDFF